MWIYNIIQWFNENNGFSTAILSVVGLLLSTIAIILSIRTAKLPYKKKIKITMSYNYCFPEGTLLSIEVYALNLGNRPVRIKKVGLAIKNNGKKEFMMKLDDNSGSILLRPTDETSYEYDITDLKKELQKNKTSSKLYIYAQDNEGKQYSKKVGRVGKIRKII